MWGGGGGHYDIWVSYLKRWAAGDPADASGLPMLAAETFAGDTWERFVNQINQAISKRLVAWAGALARAIGEARDEFGVARALTQSRAGLQAIRALAAHPGLPAELAARLTAMVDGQVRASQEALERSVESLRRSGADRAAVETRLRTIRDNSLLGAAGAPPAWAVDPSAPARRRVIPT